MTQRLKWILAVGAVLIALAYTARRRHWLSGVTFNGPSGTAAPMPEATLRDRIQLPEGFAIGTFASDIPSARMLRFTATGDLLVSSRGTGKVWLVDRDGDGDGHADGQQVLLKGLNSPHGLVLHEDWLYVAETDAVLRVRFDAASRTASGELERIIRGLPTGGHATKTIGIGPDGLLYLSMGSSCNVCINEDRRRAAITRYQLDGSGEQVYATGLRNAVGFAWQPGTGALYATDNGRDLLGDDFPPDELNRIVEGAFCGWPFANGDRVPDPNYGAGKDDLIATSIPPAHSFAAHVAALGITFYTATSFPEHYRGAAFVAQHGSWNRSRKSGYKVVALRFAADGWIDEEDFASGFEIDEKVYARPVDVAVGPDGALYVSDDFTGSIYRIAYRAP